MQHIHKAGHNIIIMQIMVLIHSTTGMDEVRQSMASSYIAMINNSSNTIPIQCIHGYQYPCAIKLCIIYS